MYVHILAVLLLLEKIEVTELLFTVYSHPSSVWNCVCFYAENKMNLI